MRMHQESFVVATPGRGATDLSRRVGEVVARADVQAGLCVVHCAHTSASLTVFENASPDALDDLLDWLARIAPDGDPRHRHDAEGPDDMPAHLRMVLTRTAETVPIAGGRLALGTWQGIFLLEHRLAPHRRTIQVHVMGE